MGFYSVSCLSASFHSIDYFFALVMLPYIYSVIAFICISASIGRVPSRMKTAGSATLIYSDRICFIHFLYCLLILSKFFPFGNTISKPQVNIGKINEHFIKSKVKTRETRKEEVYFWRHYEKVVFLYSDPNIHCSRTSTTYSSHSQIKNGHMQCKIFLKYES